jgi:transmembrane sensor
MVDYDRDTSERHRAELDARDWLVRLTSGTLSEPELERFKAWRDCRPENKAAFERERRFWNQMQNLEGAPARQSARQAARPSTSMTRRAILGGGAATLAASLALVTAPRAKLWWSSDYIVPTGGLTEIPLPDGTMAALNSGSALKIDFRDDLRLVHLLQGDAEFSIVSSSNAIPFRVASNGGIIDSLDARLSISSLDDTTTVSVVTGQASVASPAVPEVRDVAGLTLVDLADAQQTSYLSGMFPGNVSSADIEMVLAWRQGKIIFEGKPFATAINELARYVSEPVLLRPGIDHSVQVSGVFLTREPLVALQAVARTQALTVRRIPSVAIVIA